MNAVIQYIHDEGGNKTKHQQIIDGIVQAISEKAIMPGDMLPSVNYFLGKLSVARMTIVKALEELKERGIIESENRVGYFVKSGNVKQNLKVLFFLTEFNVYHEVLYNRVLSALKNKEISIDLYFHHCNPQVFKSIIRENIGMYGLYVVTPFQDSIVEKVLSEIPSKKLLQILRTPVIEKSSFISQDFNKEVLASLNSIKQQLKKYEKFTLVFPEVGKHPEIIKKSFLEFCSKASIHGDIIPQITTSIVQRRSAYFVITDSDLISLVKYGEEKKLKLGKDIGILSYNDTPMKEIIRDGISVISTDFAKIGSRIANFMIHREPIQEYIPTKIKIRKSL